MKIFTSLNSPYPIPENKWKIILFISAFISTFLFIFQPFGLSTIDSSNKTLYILGYGGVTFMVLLVNLYFVESVFTAFFSEKNWTVFRQIIWLFWILLTMGLANFLYSHAIIPEISLTWHNFFIFQFFTLVIGSFPVVITTLVTHTIYLKRYAGFAQKINTRPDRVEEKDPATEIRKLCLLNDAGNEELHIFPDEFLFLESEGNYVTIHCRNREKCEKTTIRNTLKSLREQLADFPFIVQCHRAFIVNCRQVVRVKGNAQGYLLKLTAGDDYVPVSRSFIESFNRVFRK